MKINIAAKYVHTYVCRTAAKQNLTRDDEFLASIMCLQPLCARKSRKMLQNHVKLPKN